MEFIEFLVIKGNYLLLCGIGIFIIRLLLRIEADLDQIKIDIGQTNLELNKLLNTLMTSLNDVRKLVNQKIRPARKDHSL